MLKFSSASFEDLEVLGVMNSVGSDVSLSFPETDIRSSKNDIV
jgi:hypothetical protein